MDSILSALSCSGSQLVGRVVIVNGEPIGLVTPSMMEGCSTDDRRSICGPGGVAVLEEHKSDEIVESLIATKSILFGNSKDIASVCELLSLDGSSRTTSYFCCIANNCAEVIDAHKKIRSSKVLIIGCGGIGSVAATYLAGAGIGNITLIDPDVIEASNLNRQILWSKQDIGKPKVEALKKILEDRYDVKCEALKLNLLEKKSLDWIKQYDAVVLSADEPLGIGIEPLTTMAREGHFILTACGYSHHQANVLLEICSPGEKTEPHGTSEERKFSWRRTPHFIGPSFGPMNGEIAGIVSSIVIHSLGFFRRDNILSSPSLRSWFPFNYSS